MAVFWSQNLAHCPHNWIENDYAPVSRAYDFANTSALPSIQVISATVAQGLPLNMEFAVRRSVQTINPVHFECLRIQGNTFPLFVLLRITHPDRSKIHTSYRVVAGKLGGNAKPFCAISPCGSPSHAWGMPEPLPLHFQANLLICTLPTSSYFLRSVTASFQNHQQATIIHFVGGMASSHACTARRPRTENTLKWYLTFPSDTCQTAWWRSSKYVRWKHCIDESVGWWEVINSSEE